MDHDAPISWSEHLPEESLMSAGNEDEFSNFLEFGINFPDLEGHGSAPPQHQRAMQDADNQISTSMANDTRMDTDHTTQASQYASVVGGHLGMSLHDNGQSQSQAFHFTHEQSQQHLHPQHQQHPHRRPQKQPPLQHPGNHSYAHGQHVIPPTPNSIELHGDAARYPQRVETSHDMYDRYVQMTEDQSAFYTPLLSPAMTPLETQFRLPEYTIPGEYFTPLTSPALEAQNPATNGYPFQTTQPPSSGYAPSPIDPTGMHVTSAPPSPGLIRKQRRRPSTATRTGGRAAKASPSIQPKNRRKQAMSAQLLTDDVAHAFSQDHSSLHPATSAGSSLRYGSQESSGQDSVSPEPISEPLMPPPALPQTRKSPAMGPQISEPKTGQPATPATLMRIHNQQQHMQDPSGGFAGYASLIPGESQDDPMEDVILPEAATDTRPRVSRIDTAVNTHEQLPSASSKSTPTAELRSASERPPSGSVTPGPPSGTMSSPSGTVAKQSESKPSTSRKRQNLSSSHVSPALRPRISPSIQPLVRGDSAMSGESSALYLASKSNYQHILDGTLLPGVSYPETLAENLSSKRTNHKLAEQGRRNRINTALKEIETLIPPGFVQDKAGAGENKEGTPNAKNGDKEKDKNSHQAISKASTVEMAIDYIKALKTELEETKAQLKTAESKLTCQSMDSSGAESKTGSETDSEAEAKEPTLGTVEISTTTQMTAS